MPKFSERFIASLTLNLGQKDRLVFDSACPGLGVRVTPKSRVFLVQWADKGTGRKVREVLGPWGSITLEQARQAARAKLGAVAGGINPKLERLKAAAAVEQERAEMAYTFDELIKEWAGLHLTHRRPRYAAEADRAIRTVLANLINKPAAKITRTEAVAELDAMAKAGRTAMAGRTMAYARAAYQWTVKRGRVPSNPFAELPVSAGTTQRDRVLSDDELREVWNAAGRLGYPFGPCVQLLILTLCRREEIAAMCWSEIAPDLSTWTIPASRAKNGKAHLVHLSEGARAILRSLPRMANQDLIFSTNGKTAVSGFSKAKLRLDAALIAKHEKDAAGSGGEVTPIEPWVFHDFRRTGVTWLAGAGGFPPHIADRLLNHVGGSINGVAAVYQRNQFLPERAAALDAWAAHVTAENV